MDTWPERVGIPVLKDALRMVSFVEDCLGDEKRQEAAQAKLQEVLEFLRDAIQDLEHPL